MTSKHKAQEELNILQMGQFLAAPRSHCLETQHLESDPGIYKKSVRKCPWPKREALFKSVKSTGQTFGENKYCSRLTLYNKINPRWIKHVLKIHQNPNDKSEWNFGVKSVFVLKSEYNLLTH